MDDESTIQDLVFEYVESGHFDCARELVRGSEGLSSSAKSRLFDQIRTGEITTTS